LAFYGIWIFYLQKLELTAQLQLQSVKDAAAIKILQLELGKPIKIFGLI